MAVRAEAAVSQLTLSLGFARSPVGQGQCAETIQISIGLKAARAAKRPLRRHCQQRPEQAGSRLRPAGCYDQRHTTAQLPLPPAIRPAQPAAFGDIRSCFSDDAAEPWTHWRTALGGASAP
jgi:hypothetical protein